VGVVILTQDEEVNLPACVESLVGLRHRLFILDSGSTDTTLTIARSCDATIMEHPFDNYSAQRNRAQEMLPAEIDWVLHLDADERLTGPLVDEINQVMMAGADQADGYLLRKRTIFMGRWIRHGGHYPSYHLRLFRRAVGRCEDRLYDQHFLVKGRTARLENDYEDVVATDLRSWTERHARWAGLEADEVMTPTSSGSRVRARLGGSPIERKRWLRERALYRAPLFIGPFAYFVYRYFLRGGFLDGKEGLIFHFLQGCWYRFLVDASIYEKRKHTA
jgi:glycosyltransferase involved in cell wall biosynthesis